MIGYLLIAGAAGALGLLLFQGTRRSGAKAKGGKDGGSGATVSDSGSSSSDCGSSDGGGGCDGGGGGGD